MSHARSHWAGTQMLVAVRCSVLHCVAICFSASNCSMLQCVVVRRSAHWNSHVGMPFDRQMSRTSHTWMSHMCESNHAHVSRTRSIPILVIPLFVVVTHIFVIVTHIFVIVTHTHRLSLRESFMCVSRTMHMCHDVCIYMYTNMYVYR